MLDSWEGVLKDYQPTTKMLGAVNRENVTCYLDALLFAMFSRLSSFEAMLYNSFDTPAKQRLAILLRLWINLLRSGELITTDITEQLQEALSECGWTEAARLQQQDASEAFTFITSQLNLPLLTLKMDIYHTGKEDAADDHKFINERLLEVAIPTLDPDGPQTVTLEDCLEDYFNNRIEVRRYLERRGTVGSYRSNSEKGASLHVETTELESLESPISTPSTPNFNPRDRLRHRSTSIVQQRFIPDKTEADHDPETVTDGLTKPRPRKGSLRKEVMMPAWQFFSLIPWYTGDAPTNDAQVAAHFSAQRPILGMCLKRYSMTPQGKAIRLSTQVDIPVEIGLPHFIQDDKMDNDAAIYGNFKLSLQSVVCHRGSSVDSGHYISLVRGTTGGTSSTHSSEQWMRFDDLAAERVTIIDIEQTLKDETPYLLFYQILPVDGDPGHIVDGERPPSIAASAPSESLTGVPSSGSEDKDTVTPATSEQASPSVRPSFEDPRGRSPILQPQLDGRRSSIAFSEPEILDPVPSTLPSRRGSVAKRKSGTFSRSQSQASDKLSSAFQKLTQRKSRTFDEPFTNGLRSEPVPETTVLETKDAAAVTTTSVPAERTTTDAPPNKESKDNGKTPAKKDHKREKSKGRHRLHSTTSSAGEDGKPDRECVIM